MLAGKNLVFLLGVWAMALGFLIRPATGRAAGEYPNLSPGQARELIGTGSGNPDIVVLDVRTPEEFRSERIDGAVLVDYNSGNFRTEIAKLDREKTYLVYCRTGNRSGNALKVMREAGFPHAYHLDGGIVKWKEAGLPTQK